MHRSSFPMSLLLLYHQTVTPWSQRLEPPLSRVFWREVLIMYQGINEKHKKKKKKKKLWTGNPKDFRKLGFILEWILQGRWSKSEPRASGPRLGMSLNQMPEKPNSPVSCFWEEIDSLTSRLLGQALQTTVMVFAVVQADLVRPSWSRSDSATGISVVRTDGNNQSEGVRAEVDVFGVLLMLSAVTTNTARLPSDKGSQFLPRGCDLSLLNIQLNKDPCFQSYQTEIPAFNPMRLTASFPVCSSAEHNGWAFSLGFLPHCIKSHGSTNPLIKTSPCQAPC